MTVRAQGATFAALMLGCLSLTALPGWSTERAMRPSGEARKFDLSGHRGARGLCPENTLPAFARALSIGVSTLEMDAVVTADGVVVIQHDLWLDPAITRRANGQWLDKDAAIAVNTLTLAQVQTYDVGRVNPKAQYAFKPVAVDGARIPTLASVIDLVRRSGQDDVVLSIEAKIEPEAPGLSLAPEPLARVLIDVLRAEKFADRALIQSFDWRVLQAVQKLAPEIPTVYLTAATPDYYDTLEIGKPGASKWTAGFDIDDYLGSAPKAIAAAGGKIWSPYYKEVDAAQLKAAHDLGIRVVVWTVNEPADMARYVDLGLDGIITDYPDRLRKVLIDKGRPVPKPASNVADVAACK